MHSSFFLATCALSSLLSPQDLQLDTLLAQARAARSSPLQCSGSAVVSGAEHRLALAFDGSGRFELALSGALGLTTAFDGEQAWQVDELAGVPYDLDLFLGDVSRAWLAVWTGDWCEPGFDFRIGEPPAAEEGTTVELRSPRSTYIATLVLDPETFQPRTLTPVGWGRAQTVRYTEFVKGLARRIEVVDSQGNVDTYAIDSDEPYRDREGGCGTKPEATPRNVRIDEWSERALQVKRARSGHLLVRPLVDDVDVGWFMFDTGAPMTTISRSVTEELGLEEVGHSSVGGAGADVSRVAVRQADSLELGPVRLEHPRLVEFETVGRETVGIIGWDILIHAVVEIDMQQAAITIHPRDDYELPAGEWLDMNLHMRHPHVQASFAGGHEGWFRIDTGAGSVAVMFHTPTVERFDLLAARETSPFQARGAGGQLDLRVGPIDWFEIAGHRTQRPQALFCLDETGALADGNTLGNIGGGVLSPFVLVFDYQGKRVGFVPRAETAEWD